MRQLFWFRSHNCCNHSRGQRGNLKIKFQINIFGEANQGSDYWKFKDYKVISQREARMISVRETDIETPYRNSGYWRSPPPPPPTKQTRPENTLQTYGQNKDNTLRLKHGSNYSSWRRRSFLAQAYNWAPTSAPATTMQTWDHIFFDDAEEYSLDTREPSVSVVK